MLLTALVTFATFRVQPQVSANFSSKPWGYVFALLAIAGFLGVKVFLRKQCSLRAFLSSCAYLLGMLTSVVFGVYPYVLPARNPAFSLTAQSAKAADYGLRIGLIWWTVGMILAAIYFTRVYRSFSGKVKAETSGH